MSISDLSLLNHRSFAFISSDKAIWTLYNRQTQLVYTLTTDFSLSSICIVFPVIQRFSND